MLTLLTNIRSRLGRTVTIHLQHFLASLNLTHKKIPTRQEFGSQNSLSGINLALINSYRKGILLSNIISGHLPKAEHFQLSLDFLLMY